ncbi:putative ABC transport system ATP-binding protein [Microbacterium hydrocarbonoxydans]|uniref:Putative ABC transport system ATP-binding protein n=1 Tax=Microbacterium hydrocarbonoxydans TaxID=273678 RepID=A0A1H4N1G4_9MICO|nr:putative ABC transport system ATP-binding protein [Microbacterium hydrocarbonoxydans]
MRRSGATVDARPEPRSRDGWRGERSDRSRRHAARAPPRSVRAAGRRHSPSCAPALTGILRRRRRDACGRLRRGRRPASEGRRGHQGGRASRRSPSAPDRVVLPALWRPPALRSHELPGGSGRRSRSPLGARRCRTRPWPPQGCRPRDDRGRARTAPSPPASLWRGRHRRSRVGPPGGPAGRPGPPPASQGRGGRRIRSPRAHPTLRAARRCAETAGSARHPLPCPSAAPCPLRGRRADSRTRPRARASASPAGAASRCGSGRIRSSPAPGTARCRRRHPSGRRRRRRCRAAPRRAPLATRGRTGRRDARRRGGNAAATRRLCGPVTYPPALPGSPGVRGWEWVRSRPRRSP